MLRTTDIHRGYSYLTSILFVGFLLFAPGQQSLFSQIIYVNQQASGINDGTSWENAFVDLQSALGIAVEGDEIWVARGTYYPVSSGSDRNSRFIIPDGVSIFGGFSGFENERSERDWRLFITELSGDINQSGSLFGNSYTVVDVSNTGPSTTLDGFVIQGGNSEVIAVEGYPLNNTGGGIYNNGGSPVIRNCIVTGNSANQGAGMANLFGANPSLFNVTFRNNLVVIPGGGGGMLNAEDSNPLIHFCQFESNESRTAGGAMLNIYGSSPEIRYSRFISNKALNGAAIFSFDSSKVVIVNSEFRGNESGGNGGAIAATFKSTFVIENCLFSGNKGERGGAFFSEGDTMWIYNSTVVGNIASTGGAVWVRENARIIFKNSILWNNRSTVGEYPDFDAIDYNVNSQKVRFKNSIIEGSYAPEEWNVLVGTDDGGNRSFDPLFDGPAPLSNRPFTEGSYRLTECSPAVNFGNNDLMGNLSTTDLGGNARIIDEIVDIGAYEYEGEVPPPVIFCADVIVELNLRSYRSFNVNDFFVVVDSCGPVQGTIYGLDSLKLDCSQVGFNSFTLIATDLYTGLSDTCEFTIEVKNPFYYFNVNGIPLIPGDTLSICPGAILDLGIDSVMYSAAPIFTAFTTEDSGPKVETILSASQAHRFSYDELGVYRLQFQSIFDANGCLVEGEEAGHYQFFFRVAVSADTSYHSASVCIRTFYRDIKVHSDTVLQFLHLNLKGCDSLEVVEISVYESPDLSVVGDEVICWGETGYLSIDEEFEEVEWSVYPYQTQEIRFVQSAEISVVAVDSFGCIFTESIEVVVLEPVIVNHHISPAHCYESANGFLEIISISGGLAPFQYHLMDDNGVVLNNFTDLSPGWYSLNVVDSNNCQTEEVIEIPLIFSPEVTILGPDRIDKGDSLLLLASHSFPHEVQIDWFINDRLYSTGSDQIRTLPNEDLNVLVQLEDSLGCKVEVRHFVWVYEPIQIFVPNVFSPNKDGINDRLTIFTDGGDEILSLRVFDRWGAIVFEQKNFPSNIIEIGWDGEFRGRKMPQGEYLYQLELLDDGELRKFAGTVLLMR
ncbi:MAG: hypothetical protein EA409_01145 [Saprospirales bacterium]|nr:MAG: hypothetical protein EA409_01145 [Saprospirales bacterium]